MGALSDIPVVTNTDFSPAFLASSISDDLSPITYELFLSKLGDESQLQSICHMYSHEEFSKRSRKFQLPIIILSVISGSGNFVSSSFPDYQELIILGVGVLSIFTSIISSIAQYLKLAEKSESHRIAFISWEKFYNSVRFQLCRRRADREEITNYMKNTTGEFQRLQEISPILPEHIVTKAMNNGKTKKQIKQMSIPVSLRSVVPSTWWRETDKLDKYGKKIIDTPSPPSRKSGRWFKGSGGSKRKFNSEFDDKSNTSNESNIDSEINVVESQI